MTGTTRQELVDTDGDAVLIAFAQAGAGADLADWVRRHPRHARDLARMAAERWTGGEGVGADHPEDVRADERLMEIGRAVFRAARESGPVPLTSLKAAAQARGLDAEAVAARLGLPETYFWKLHRRLFAPDSLPHALVAALARVLDRTAAEVGAYLAKPPTLAAGARYRAEAAPSVGAREDFALTLRDDPEVQERQRARWLSPEGG